MPAKTMNVSVPAYEAAHAAKRPGESFSDLLLRTFRPTSLLDLAGILTPEQSDELDAAVADGRRRSRERAERQADWWNS